MTNGTSFALLLASIAGIASVAPTLAQSGGAPGRRVCRPSDASPQVTITVAAGEESLTFHAADAAAARANGDGTFDFGGGHAAREGWTLDYDLVVDPDPFVFNSMRVTNLDTLPKQFTITVALPATPMGPTTINAYARGKLFDRNGDGAASCLFTGSGEGAFCLIDGTIVASMTMLAGTSVITTAPVAPIGPVAKPPVPGPPVLSSIAMTLTLTLSAGDAVELTGAFIVN